MKSEYHDLVDFSEFFVLIKKEESARVRKMSKLRKMR